MMMMMIDEDARSAGAATMVMKLMRTR